MIFFTCRTELIRRFGITVAFLATHSGLTRWQTFPQNYETEPHFHIVHNKAIDEVWYKRAVEYHYIDSRSFIYSVPFYIGDANVTLVTVSQAIFKEENGLKAPTAVVGYQFHHTALYTLFKQITSSCGVGGKQCKRTCESGELHCLILDDNGYVIVSDNLAETGYFFGQVRSDIMSYLVEDGIYRVKRMFDYQGLCPEGPEVTSPASRLVSVSIHFANLVKWLTTTLITLTRSVFGAELETMVYPDQSVNDEHENEIDIETADQQPPSQRNEKEFDQRLLIKKTKPEPCDHEMFMYNLQHFTERSNRSMANCSRPFLVEKVSNSNMILIVINNLCREDQERLSPSPDASKVDYNMTLSCYRALNNDYPRRHYMSCINKSANESEIKLCGTGSHLISSNQVISILIIFVIFNSL